MWLTIASPLHRAGVAQEELHIYLSLFDFNRPGGEGVAEVVRVAMGDTGSLRRSPQHDLEGVRSDDLAILGDEGLT